MRIHILGLALLLTACGTPKQNFDTPRTIHLTVKGNYSAIGECVVQHMQSGRYDPGTTRYQEFSNSKTAVITSNVINYVPLRIALKQEGETVTADVWGTPAIGDVWRKDGVKFVQDCAS